jgi:Domain of unknown function (DUF4864)
MMLRLCYVAFAIFLAVTYPVLADDRDGIRAIITDQLQAFKADDGARAYSHASDGIKQIFPSPEMFMSMVKTGYPPVYRAKSWSFADPLSLENGFSQTVRLTDEQGQSWNALYTLERDSTGEWKITSCRLFKSDGTV